MKVVIAGAGEVGTHLARMLSNEDHDIVLMDDSPEKLSRISSEVDLMTVTGSAHSFSDLKRTDLAKSDLFIAVTPFEERNVLACAMASYLGVGRTIARINNQEYLQERYRSKLNNMGIHELIYPESLAAKEIIASVVKDIGPHSKPDKIQFTPALPKTRSGKIMRRILRKIAENQVDSLGDTSTLADPTVVDALVENRK